ncbi:hypothetical protein HA402_012572 [Bradysia odoriphaga]|nr:hypothetical protein HA402_012572 [Bradysia odoriphaga]
MMNLKRGKTGLIYDFRMTEHRCLWNSGYPECPERFTRILARCDELKLIERCHSIPSRPATLNEILLKHTREHYDALKAFHGETDEEKLEEMSSHYSIFLHPSTFELSMLAVGCAVELVDKILLGEVQNGMAVIRPPGHHAMESQFDGFCFFNNIAIAAQHAINNHGVNRILIVDFDVHHGNGTQQLFYDDPRVLYFSTHRFDYGTFFPGLRESDFDYVGQGRGTGFNFNVALNKGGMTNSDYLAIWQQILLPVATEVGDNYSSSFNTISKKKDKILQQFQPELVLISAGYDSAYGCAIGKMEITPACYAHLVSPLAALANGRIAAFLEGGYNLESLAEGAAITLKTLLGDPCPLLEMLNEPSDSVRDSILNCTQSHKAYWSSLQVHKEYSLTVPIGDQSNNHEVIQKFIDDKALNRWHNCVYYDTRFAFPNQTRSKEDEEKISKHLQHLKSVTKLDKPLNRCCFVVGKTGLIYDFRMTEHRCLWNSGYPECPERFTRILARCDELKLIERCHSIPSRPATLNEILLKHTREHYDTLKAFDGETDEDKLEEMCTHYDIFIHPSTFELSMLAVGCAVELVDKILLGEVQNGMAIIRPPGHHAMESQFDGFCFFNNVAIAAQHAINNHGMNRILIVDFDVHHGNGTQQLFYDDPRVLYFSIHRFDYGTFFPGLRESDFDYVGEGRGTGFNFNVALNKGGMTNSDYLAIWQQILLPVATEFQPELVLISAGYDAAYGCALGEMEITPACYAHLISPLAALANGRIAAFLEGGYHLESLAESAAITLKTFLGDPCPLLEMLDEPSDSVRDSILNCIQSHKAYWSSLKVHKEYSLTAPIGDQSNNHEVIQKFIDDKELNPWHNCDYYDPRLIFPNQTRSKEDEEKISKHLQHLKSITNLDKPLNRTCFVVSERNGDIERFLLEHDLLDSLYQPETGFKPLPSLDLSCESAPTLELLHNVLEEKYLNGIHMELGEGMVADSIALATRYATEVHGLKRVLVVDLCKTNRQNIDTQPYENGNILYTSLDLVDAKDTLEETVGDSDYVAAFQRIIMPIAYEFNPELVLISADFDAINELLEANISSELFGYLSHWLSALANGKVILFLKGKCRATSTCINALLGNPLPMPKRHTGTKVNNIATIQNVLSIQQNNWKSLKFNKMLPSA